MRKRLTILFALCLTAIMSFGIIGSGAQFLSSVTAQQNINVGRFDCMIATANHTTGAVIAADGKSISYTVPTITSSAAGSAPFFFDVLNSGSINQTLTITNTAVGSPFSVIGSPFIAVPVAPSTVAAVHTGVRWGELTNENLGATGAVTWTVSCGEQVAEPLPANTYVAPSTNVANQAAGHPYFTSTPQNGAVQLTFYDAGGTVACFEYRTDGNVPEQRLGPGEVVGATPFLLNYHGVNAANANPGALEDGLYSYICPGHAIYGMAGASYGNPATITVPVSQYVEVRLVFGAERDYDFDWTRVNGL